MNLQLLAGSATALILAFFFSGMETAYRHADAARADLDDFGDTGSLSAAQRIVRFFSYHPDWFIATARVGNTLCVVAFAVLMAVLAAPFYGHTLRIPNITLLVIVQTLITTGVVLFTADLLSHRLFKLDAAQVLRALALVFGIFFVILAPLTFPLLWATRFVAGMLNISYDPQRPVFGFTDLSQYFKGLYKVEPETGSIHVDEKIFYNALEFKTVKIRECMIPRTEITACHIDDTIDKLRETFVESGHSKIIVYSQGIDDVVGYCHSSSLFRKPAHIRDILTPIIIVAETSLANELMIRFINERKSLAVVVDEFGGTSGIVSMEDVIEEIFGDIEDEHDEDTLVEQQLDTDTYLLSARLEIDYLNETYHWELPTGEYETLGGLILALAEDFPQAGQTFEIPPFTFTVQSTNENLITLVNVRVQKGE